MGLGSWLGDAADWVGDTLDDAANATEDGLNAAGEAISDVLEAAGNGVEDLLNIAAGVPVLGAVIGWVGAVVSGVLDVVGSAVKGVCDIVGGVLGGVIHIVGGILSFSGSRIVTGVGDIFSGIFGSVGVFLGQVGGVVGAVLFVKGRRLTKDEEALLKTVFHSSVAYYNVRLVEGWAGIYSLSSRAFTLGNTIYLKDHDPSAEPQLLVHECTHVWMYQNRGSRYLTDAGYAIATIDDQYDWEAEIADGRDRWVDWNPEAQAEFLGNSDGPQLHDVFTGGALYRGTSFWLGSGNGCFYRADEVDTHGRFLVGNADHTQRANNALKVIRDETSWRLSKYF